MKIGYQGVGCFDTSSAIEVNFNPTIKPKIVGDKTFCGNNPTTLRAVPTDAAFQYEWKFFPFKTDSTLSNPILLPGFPVRGTWNVPTT